MEQRGNLRLEIPKIATIIPSARAGEDLNRALLSLSQQNLLPTEIVVVLADPVALASTSDVVIPNNIEQRTILVEAKEKLLAPVARNLGFESTNSDFVHFLDDDDALHPDFYHENIKFFQKNPHISATSNSVIWISESGATTGYSIRRAGFATEDDLLVENLAGITSSVVIKSQVFAASGGFDVSLPARQDYELWIRISAIAPIYLSEKLMVLWTVHSDSESISNSSDLSKHLKAVQQIREIKAKRFAEKNLSWLSQRASHANEYLYLARRAKGKGRLRFFRLIFRGIYWFPSIRLLMELLPYRLVSEAKKLRQKINI